MTALEKGERSGINQDGVDWGYVTVRAGLMQEGSGRGSGAVGTGGFNRQLQKRETSWAAGLAHPPNPPNHTHAP